MVAQRLTMARIKARSCRVSSRRCFRLIHLQWPNRVCVCSVDIGDVVWRFFVLLFLLQSSHTLRVVIKGRLLVCFQIL